jgi:hypothetical protein
LLPSLKSGFFFSTDDGVGGGAEDRVRTIKHVMEVLADRLLLIIAIIVGSFF